MSPKGLTLHWQHTDKSQKPLIAAGFLNRDQMSDKLQLVDGHNRLASGVLNVRYASACRRPQQIGLRGTDVRDASAWLSPRQTEVCRTICYSSSFPGRRRSDTL